MCDTETVNKSADTEKEESFLFCETCSSQNEGMDRDRTSVLQSEMFTFKVKGQILCFSLTAKPPSGAVYMKPHSFIFT